MLPSKLEGDIVYLRQQFGSLKSDMEPDLPIELIIHGYPVSHQSKRKGAVEKWKQDVHDQAWLQLEAVQEGHFAIQQLLVVTIYFFPRVSLGADLDNVAKPVLDGLTQCAFTDDMLIERLVIQRFEPEKAIKLPEVSPVMEEAFKADEPTIYIRLEAFEEENQT